MRNQTLHPGDKVMVICSPYSSVKNGTVAIIKEIKRDYFKPVSDRYSRPGYDLYVLAGLPHTLFREYELKSECGCGAARFARAKERGYESME